MKARKNLVQSVHPPNIFHEIIYNKCSILIKCRLTTIQLPEQYKDNYAVSVVFVYFL